MATTQEWLAEVQRLHTASGPELSRLSAAMADDAAAPGRALGHALGDVPEVASVAKFLLLQAGPAALEGLLDLPTPEAPDERAWFVDRLLEFELQTRARVRARILQLLDDPRWLRDPREGQVLEVYPPRRRVCDHAYVTMRELTHPEEDQVGFSVETQQFLHAPAELKDAAIRDARSSHVWNHPAPEPDDA
jgi:hypothetical protein